MLDSTLNATHLRNAFKCAAPHFGLNSTVMPLPMESDQPNLPQQAHIHQQKPHTTGYRPQFMRGLDRGH